MMKTIVLKAKKPFRGCNHRQICKLATVTSLLGSLIPLQAQQTASTATTDQETTPPSDLATSPDGKPASENSLMSWQKGDWGGYFMFTAQVRYDDNILQTDQKIVSDFVGVAIPSANVDYTPSRFDGTLQLHADYSPQFIGYLNNPQYNTIDQLANFKLDDVLDRSEFRLTHQYTLSTSPEIDAPERAPIQIQDTELYAGYDLSDKTVISLAPRQEWSEQEQNGLTVWEYGATAAVTYHQTEKLEWRLSYYGAEVVADPGITAFRQQALAGMSWAITGRSTLDMHAGIQEMIYNGGTSTTTPDVGLYWTWHCASKTTSQLGVSYDTDFSRYNAFQLNKSLSVNWKVDYDLTQKVGLEFRSAYAMIDQTSVNNDFVNGGELNYWSLGGGVSYQLNDHAKLGLDYDHYERVSDNDFWSYQRNVVQLSFTYRF